jgi:hypothetical protein
MKKGKSVSLKGYKKFKVNYGTVDSKNLKSFYINIQSWLNPKRNEENWERVVMNFNRSIRHTIYEILKYDFIETNFIVDTDLRSSGLSCNKSSFMNLEITFFLKNISEFKSPKIKDFVKESVDLIDNENFKSNKYFTFALTKTDKTKVINIYE